MLTLKKKALSIVFGIKKFHLYDRKFINKSDHKPLQSIWHPIKSILTLGAAHIQCCALLLCSYNYDIMYKEKVLYMQICIQGFLSSDQNQVWN